MSFNHPEFLYALFAILIPILIHLFNFRRYKKLWFSNIQFLKNITTETRKQNKLKQLLILLLRILAVVFIVFAFAGPDFRKENALPVSSNSLAAIYLDNSFSMMSEGKDGRLFEEALKLATRLMKQMPRDKQFLLISNESTSGRKLKSKEAILSDLNDVTISPTTRNISSVIRSAEKIKKDKGFNDVEFYLISDFQKNVFDATAFPLDSTGNFYFLPQQLLEKKNIYLDSCWITAPVILPGRPVDLSISVKNDSESDYDKVPLKVMINGQQKAVAGVDLKAGSTKIMTVNFTVYEAGWHTGKIEVEDYPIIFDDDLYFTFNVQRKINILEITEKKAKDALHSFYETDEVFDFRTMDYKQVNYNRLPDFNLIILNGLPDISTGLIGQLKETVQSGKNLFFVPGTASEQTGYNAFLEAFNAGKISGPDTTKTRVSGINRQSEMFREAITHVPDNADFPSVFKHFKYQYRVSNGLESLIDLLNGDAFLLKKNFGNGLVYLLAVPLNNDYSNFLSNSLFVPVMYNAAVQGISTSRLFYVIGEDNIIESDLTTVPISEKPFSLHKKDSDFSIIPEQKINSGKLTMDLHGGIVEAGYYDLTENDSVYRSYAFNFNRKESQMNFLSTEQLNQELKRTGIKYYQVLNSSDSSMSKVIKTIQKENDLWKLFIIFALLMLLTEILILRFWK
jgi:hypothetical protein